MAVTGWVGCGTGADDATFGTQEWINTALITAQDDTGAQASNIGNVLTHYLVASNCIFLNSHFGGFTNCTINSVQFRQRRQANAGTCTDANYKILKGGTIQGNNVSDGSTWSNGSWESHVYTITPAACGLVILQSDIVGVTNFGIAQAGNTGGAATLTVDFVEMQVDYTPLPGGNNMMLMGVG
jgi:hypothetical protein